MAFAQSLSTLAAHPIVANTLVTVVIAAYDEENHIAQCLQSILEQSYQPIEVIVVDDGSSDRTVEVVTRFPSVRLISQTHRGKAPAVNRGALEAAGEILLFLDGDMFFEKDYVSRMIAPILSGRCIGTCHTNEYVANPENIWSACLQMISRLPLNRRLHLNRTQLAEGSDVFRAVKRDRFLRVGGFDHAGHLDDQTLFPKLNQKAQFVEDTICYHHNPETLREVFSSGKWSGKSIALCHGPLSFVRFLPILSPFRAAVMACRLRSLPVVIYQSVYEAGIFCGILNVITGADSGYGK